MSNLYRVLEPRIAGHIPPNLATLARFDPQNQANSKNVERGDASQRTSIASSVEAIENPTSYVSALSHEFPDTAERKAQSHPRMVEVIAEDPYSETDSASDIREDRGPHRPEEYEEHDGAIDNSDGVSPSSGSEELRERDPNAKLAADSNGHRRARRKRTVATGADRELQQLQRVRNHVERETGFGLLDAAHDNDISRLRMLLRGRLDAFANKRAEYNGNSKLASVHSVDVDFHDDVLKDTPLIVAAGSGFFQATKLLLNAGARPNERNELGRTALMVAAENSSVEIVQHLLSRGADPALSDKKSTTALHLACRSKCVAAVQLLLNASAPVDALTSQGRSPLLEAAAAGSSDCMALIIGSGASLRVRDNAGESFLSLPFSSRSLSGKGGSGAGGGTAIGQGEAALWSSVVSSAVSRGLKLGLSARSLAQSEYGASRKGLTMDKQSGSHSSDSLLGRGRSGSLSGTVDRLEAESMVSHVDTPLSLAPLHPYSAASAHRPSSSNNFFSAQTAPSFGFLPNDTAQHRLAPSREAERFISPQSSSESTRSADHARSESLIASAVASREPTISADASQREVASSRPNSDHKSKAQATATFHSAALPSKSDDIHSLSANHAQSNGRISDPDATDRLKPNDNSTSSLPQVGLKASVASKPLPEGAAGDSRGLLTSETLGAVMLSRPSEKVSNNEVVRELEKGAASGAIHPLLPNDGDLRRAAFSRNGGASVQAIISPDVFEVSDSSGSDDDVDGKRLDSDRNQHSFVLAERGPRNDSTRYALTEEAHGAAKRADREIVDKSTVGERLDISTASAKVAITARESVNDSKPSSRDASNRVIRARMLTGRDLSSGEQKTVPSGSRAGAGRRLRIGGGNSSSGNSSNGGVKRSSRKSKSAAAPSGRLFTSQEVVQEEAETEIQEEELLP